MSTIEVTVTEDLPLEPQVFLAAQAIMNGELVVFPTETVYGIGCDMINDRAIDDLIAIKHRPEGKPFPVMVLDIEMAKTLANLGAAEALAKDYWPGPLTLVVPAIVGISDACELNGTVGLRCPSSEVARAILRLTQCPLAVPSANDAGEPPATNSAEARRVFPYNDGIAFRILLSKPLSGRPTTVLKIEPKVWTILRKGPISADTIRKYLPADVELKEL